MRKGVFPLVLIQVKSAAKRTVLGLKNKRKRAFLPFKHYRLNSNLFIFKQFDMLHRGSKAIYTEGNETSLIYIKCVALIA